MARPPNRLVPAYALYGETAADRFPDPLHIETIAARSTIHDWRIRPHRHAELWQVFVLAAGGGTAHLDGSTRTLVPPLALLMPPLAVHGFSFEPGTQGHVVSIPADILARSLGQPSPGAASVREEPLLRALPPPDLARLRQLLSFAADEFSASAEGRTEALAALGALLVLTVRRLDDTLDRGVISPAADGTKRSGATPMPGHVARSGAAQTRLVQTFLAQVETDFRLQPPLADRARRLRVSVPHLSRACRAVLGRSALAVVQDRLLLEARRHLVYTSMTVQEIAYGLGFSDPAYFTRFFTARAGRTPTAYRRDRSA